MWHRDQYRLNPYGGSIYPPTHHHATPSTALTNNALDATKNTGGSSKRQGRLRVAAIIYGMLGLLAVFSNFELLPTGAIAFARQLHRILTTNGVLCINNIYAETPEAALAIPEVPPMDEEYIPSYIKICYEWMRRESLLPLPTPDCSQTPCICPTGYVYKLDGSCKHETLRISENTDICVDWRAPHYAMMEILASMVLQKVIPELEYKHLCSNHRKFTSDEAILHFDWTPVQTIFKHSEMGVDSALFPNAVEDLKSQCKVALKAYDPVNEVIRIRSRSLFHPFSFPATSTSVLHQQPPIPMPAVFQRTELSWIPEYPTTSGPNLAPISAVASQVRTRLHLKALEWVDVTNAPENEAIAGTVILVDNGSHEMDPAIFGEYIDANKVTSISILSPPLCVTANLPTGKPCMNYTEDLRSYFAEQYPDLAAAELVTSKIVTSSAGEWSRAINAQNLMCSPNTASCLFPALGRIPQDVPSDSPIPDPPLPATILFDVPESGAAAKFMEIVGRCGEINPISTETCAKVIQLATVEDVPKVEGTPDEPDRVEVPTTVGGDEPAPSFTTETDTGDGVTEDGFLAANYTQDVGGVDPLSVAQQSPREAYLDSNQDLPLSVQNVSMTEEDLDKTVDDPYATENDSSSPLGANNDGNTEVDKTSEKQFTTEEIQQALNSGTPLDGNAGATSGESVEDLASDSSLLVADENVESQLKTSFLDEVTYGDLIDLRMLSMQRIKEEHFVAPSYELHCPEETLTGDVQVLEGGYSMYDDSAAGTVTISDQNGIVTFQAPVTISSITPQIGTFIDPYNHSISYEVEYITVYDSALEDDVNVTGTIVSKAGSDLRVQDSVGSCYVDELPDGTFNCTLLLDGKAADINSAENTHTLITGKCTGIGAESVHLTPQGTVVLGKGGEFQVIAQENTNTFLVDEDPAEPPMAPDDPYQWPTTSTSSESVDRQLSPLFPDGITTDQCVLQKNDNPIYLDNHDQVPGQVTFDLKQIWKSTKHISWVAVDYEYRRFFSCDDIARNPCTNANLGKYFEAYKNTQFIHCGAGNLQQSCNLKSCGPGTAWDQGQLTCVHANHENAYGYRPGSQGGRRCKKKNRVKYGFDKRMKKMTALCDPVTNKATIDIYLYDGSNTIRQADEVDRTDLVPNYCSPSNGKAIKSWPKTKSSGSKKKKKRRRLAVEEERDDSFDDDIGFLGRKRHLATKTKGKAKAKSGKAPSKKKQSAGKPENNVCLYRYSIDCPAVATARRRLQSHDPPPVFYPQQSQPEPQGGYPQVPFPQEYQSLASNAPQQQQQPTKHRRSLFSRISSVFKGSDAPRRDRTLLAESQEPPLFGGPTVLGICPKGVSKRTGEVVFNGYQFGNGIQNQPQQVPTANIFEPTSDSGGFSSIARRMKKRTDVPIIEYEERQLRGSGV